MSGLIGRTPVQGSASYLSAKVTAVYDRTLLERAVANQIFDMFGQSKVVPANSNAKKAFAYRYKNILPATTPLAEYNGSNIKAPNKIVREEVEYGVAHYGDYITYTDELDLYDFDTIESSFLDILGDQASLTIDTITRDTLRAGTNVVYADGAVSRLEVADSKKVHVSKDFDIMAIKLKNQGGKKFKKVITASTKVGTAAVRSAYVGIVDPSLTPDLRALPGWQNVENYSDYSKAYPNEIGRIGDFRIIESDNNEPIANQGTNTDTNVYLSLFFAENAYATVTLRGKGGIVTKVKPLGSSGAEDPLDQYGTIGWKAIHGAAILNEAWLIRTEATATVEDATAKHYYDYS